MDAAETAALAAIVKDALAGDAVSFDTETNGEPPGSPAFELRIVSLASRSASVVLDAQRHRKTLTPLMAKPFRWFAHNAEFDRAVILHGLGVDMPPIRDTFTLAHLVDPRGKQDGGSGHTLAALAERYCSMPKQKDALDAEMKLGGWTWGTIPIDNPVYLEYAQRDAVVTRQLVDALDVPAVPSALELLEYGVAGACARMQDRGVLVDRPYTADLVERLRAESGEWARVAASLGVANVNSPRQVCAALGTASASKDDLEPLVHQGNELAIAITKSKRAAKWASSYAGAFLRYSEVDGRLHARIAPLQARTGRMSISNPPLQQLPASAAMVRNCLVADEGMVIWSVDFKAVEMRVLAALSRDRALTAAIASGADLHDIAAEAIFGSEFSKDQRKLAKIAAFCTVYGGGAKAVARQTGADLLAAQNVREGFMRAYPGVRRYGRQLSEQAKRHGRIVTRTGRKLPVDADRGYAALNYAVQSCARDVFAEALLRVEAAGLGEYLLLPIHDELLGQAPAAQAAEIAQAVAKAMETDLDGVKILTDWSVGGRAWGSLYERD